jgi:hypothetical protein
VSRDGVSNVAMGGWLDVIDRQGEEGKRRIWREGECVSRTKV